MQWRHYIPLSVTILTLAIILNACLSGYKQDDKFITHRYLPLFREFSGGDLDPNSIMDTAVLIVENRLDEEITLLGQNSVCVGCPLVEMAPCPPFANTSVLMRLSFGGLFELMVRSKYAAMCRFAAEFKEHARTRLVVSKTGSVCSSIIEDAGSDRYIPLYILTGLLAGLSMLSYCGKLLWRRYKHHSDTLQNAVVQESSNELTSSTTSSSDELIKPATSRRIRSLDTFRGATLLLMIFVNTGAGGYSTLEHAVWNGLQLADVLFPWFMLMMGISMHVSHRSAIRKGIKKARIFRHIIRRSVLLFLFGLMINSMGAGSIDMETFRIPSVLGRFSIAYLVVATTDLIFLTKSQGSETARWKTLADIVPFWPVWMVSLVFPFAHVMLTFLLEVPGCPRGYLGPGGLHQNASYQNCTGGAANYIDKTILGPSHIYQWPTPKKLYQTGAFDPEGILGYLTSIFLVFLGLQGGRILSLFDSHRNRLARWFAWAVALGLIAGVLCGFSKDDGWIPVNKNLWSLSFVLTASSLGFLVLSALYVLIDVLHWWDGSPLYFPSQNSIVVYVGSEILDDLFPFSWQMPDSHAAQLFMSAWTTLVWLLISWMMWRKNIAISL